MADSSDVEEAIKTLIANAVYPNGVANPSAISGNTQCRIYRGWPNASALDADLLKGIVNITIFPRNGVERNTTRYYPEWQTSVAPVHTLTVSATSNTVTLGGTVQAGQTVMVLGAVSAASVAYTATGTDTLSSAAAGLAAAAVTAGYAGTTSSGPTVTFGGHPGILRVRIASTGTSWRELGRQEKQFIITAWTNSATQRDAVMRLIGPVLRATPYLTLADGSAGRMTYSATQLNDAPEKELLYRRDLIYTVEYPESQVETDYEVADVLANIIGGQSSDGTVNSITSPAVPSNN